jgi:hypothetical protein
MNVGGLSNRPQQLTATQLAQHVLQDAQLRLQTQARLDELGDALGQLRPVPTQTQASFPMSPLPFTLTGDVAAGYQDPGACLTGLAADGRPGAQGAALVSEIVQLLDQIGAQFGTQVSNPSVPAGSPFTTASTRTSVVAGATGSEWGGIDTMMAAAEQLAQSDKPSDQLKAQKLMNQAKMMFETISKILQQISEMAKTAIGNIR